MMLLELTSLELKNAAVQRQTEVFLGSLAYQNSYGCEFFDEFLFLKIKKPAV